MYVFPFCVFFFCVYRKSYLHHYAPPCEFRQYYFYLKRYLYRRSRHACNVTLPHRLLVVRPFGFGVDCSRPQNAEPHPPRSMYAANNMLIVLEHASELFSSLGTVASAEASL